MGQRQVLALAWQSCTTSHINTHLRQKEKEKKKKNMQENILEPAPIMFWLPLHTTGTKFPQSSAPSKWENNVTNRVIQKSQGSKTSNQVPEVVLFTTDMLWGSNHNHLQTICPTWSCCYTTTHCAGQDSDFIFMFWVFNLYLSCSNHCPNHKIAVQTWGPQSFRLYTRAPNSPIPTSQQPHP